MEQHEYIQTYLDNMAIELRPDATSPKFIEAMRTAWRNDWDSKTLAQLVQKNNFTTANSPVGAALYRLERLANEKFSYSTSGWGEKFGDNHCLRKGCKCTHKECDRGWFDGGVKYVAKGDTIREYDTTKPCQMCKPELVERLNSVY